MPVRYKYCLAICIGAVLWSTAAFGNVPSFQSIADNLRLRLQDDAAHESLRIGNIWSHSPLALAQFYAERTYQPAWLYGEGLRPVTDTLIQVVKQAAHEGLQPGDYHDSELHRMLTAVRSGELVTADQWTDMELLLSDAWLTYGRHVSVGRIPPQQRKQQWPLPERSENLPKILQEALKTNRVSEALLALAPSYSTYARLRTALAHYRHLANAGGWPLVGAGDALEKGMQHPRVKELRARLQITGELTQVQGVVTGNGDPAEMTSSIAEDRFDEALLQAVRRFQRRHGLAADGVVGPLTLAALNMTVTERIQQLELNMERLRWLPEHLGQRYILVNIPDFTMQVINNGRPVINTKVIVGMPERPTPVLSAKMSYLVLNPRWYVPHSITVKDYLPKLRKDPYALVTKKFHIYDTMGQEVDPDSVNWHALSLSDFPYRLRQDPGPQNALGRVKFMFPNPYHVYLHDTPSHALFNRSRRAYSSGCVRVANAIALAEYILKDHPYWTQNAIRTAIGDGKRQRTVYLPEEIPVHFLYWTAWVVRDGSVHFREDIYKWDKHLTQVLQAVTTPKQSV